MQLLTRALLMLFCIALQIIVVSQSKIKGLSFVAPHEPFDTNPFEPIKKVNADWIAVIPYAFTRPSETIVHYNHNESNKRWWGEGRVGVKETIKQAQANGLKIMLKPQVWCGNGWIGNLDYKTKEDWQKWEASYEEYILPFASLADSLCVEMLCIGTEIKQSVIKRPSYWHQLIPKIRKYYSGMITYAANWDEYKHVDFWDKLDYIGIDAYFPLHEDKTPQVHQLISPMESTLNELDKYSKKHKRKILFTEYGYLSVDGAGGKTWELEANLRSLNYNPEAQANCIAAMLACCSNKSWWAGGFLWKWYPEVHKMRRGIEKDHSPQGKVGEDSLRVWYGKM